MITLKTKEEIKLFQKKNGLVVDGIVGPNTKRALANSNKPISLSAKKEPDKKAIKSGLSINVNSGISKKIIQDLERKVGLSSLSRIKKSVESFPLDTVRKISEIIIHCAATPEGKFFDVRDVTAWHKQRGWNRCGYHGVICLDGTIQIGSTIGQIGIHTAGHNTGTVGFSYIGGLTKDSSKPKDTRTPEQTLSLYYLCERTVKKFNITRPIAGHNQYAKKACPSFYVPNDVLSLTV